MLSDRLYRYEPGRAWIVTGTEADGENSVRVEFLFSRNRRRHIWIAPWSLRDENIIAIGNAMDAARIRFGKGRKNV